MAKVIVVDDKRCLGCKSCVLACALAHSDAGSLAEAVAAEVPPQARVHVEPLGDRALPLQCRHCEDAPCMAVCPTGAIGRAGPDAPVLIDPDRCIGCRFCMVACPFGVIELSRDGRAMVKCDLCIERTEAGKPPACVEACPTRALRFVEPEEPLRGRRREVARRLAAARAEQDDDAGL